MSPTIEQVRKAKAAMLSAGKIPLTGVGIVQKDGVLGLKVNVATSSDIGLVPAQVDGVPVHEVRVVGQAFALPL